MLGFHLEGPYISAQYKGAHESKYIYPYEEGDIKFDNIKLLTMAPEIKNAEKLMQKCRESKTIISLGHSGADFEESIRGIEMGGVCLTHIFNAMSPLNHRQPGLIGAAYEKNLFVQLIGDGIHISPTVVKMVFDLFGSEKVILISDAIRAAGLTDGEYSLVGQKVIVKNRKATLANGVIAGSSMLIPDMIKNLVSYGIRLEDVIRACTYNPAELLGLQKEKGVIESGAVADLVVLDRNLNVVHVFRNGIMVGCIPEQ
jgi:N-acetylglucosamine-6-phosphate deacetylase